MAGRVPLMAGNWKMNLSHIDALGCLQKLAWTLADHHYDAARSECVVLPPFTDLRTVQTLVEGDRLPIRYGAQDVSPHDDGAYTGDISADMLVKLGCTYVVVGHSERRQYHGETDEIVNAKARRCLAKNLVPIICVGEGLDVRKAGDQVAYTVAQVRGALAQIPASAMADLVIAYEPVWAIGTGEVATPEDAQEVCGAIRATVAELYDAPASEAVRILYGGSVKAGNIVALMAKPDIDGALVGGASLNPEEFAMITRYYDLPM
ncbi:MAG: triose-phosphate isomerase [Propionibacteriaceae bacterium]|nr:triose-phosphate isomerase [Propionibacteriaceae bacterium]